MKTKTSIGITLLILTALGATALIHITTSSDSVQTTDISQETTIQISTGATDDGDTPGYGLLPLWQTAYDGSSALRSYHLNESKPSTVIAEECGNCHMEGYDDDGSTRKIHAPFHPLTKVSGGSTAEVGFNRFDTDQTGNWFYDDDLHRGPNTELAAGYAGIKPQGSLTVQCGDCHTATNNNLATSTAGATNDPHSVHRDVLTREGCIRCHVYNNRTFSGDITFTQGNATRSTYGIANPINMTRIWDGKFLSTAQEANYSYDAGVGGLNTSGTGWNIYGTVDGGHGYTYACPDCHDQFHAEQGLTGTSVEFSFNDSASSRKGPYAPVEHKNSWGLNVSGVVKTCGDCHVTDAHAVHTNGGLSSQASWDEFSDATDQSIINASVLGAELCDECHSQNVPSGTNKAHPVNQEVRGLSGSPSTSHNRPPDLESGEAGSNGDGPNYDPSNPEDCGFCHE